MDSKTVPSPKVSVIVPIYGVENYIERCARSLFSQTFKSVEFIFVNDCTKDGSMDVLSDVRKEYPEADIKVINLERNMGLPQARRAGVEQATGDYILHVDSDDWIEPDMLEILYERAVDTGADMVCCDWAEEYEDHDEVFSQGGGAVALGADVAHGGDKAHTRDGIKGHPTQHAVAMRQETVIGHQDASMVRAAGPCVIVCCNETDFAHDGLQG